jgi:hypothetical protein
MRTAVLCIAACLCASIGVAPADTRSAEQAKHTAKVNAAAKQPRNASDAMQQRPKAEVQLRNALRQRVNSGLVGIVFGPSESESPGLLKLSDFFDALEKDESLRIFQVGGRGAAHNAIELSFARGIDGAIIQSDVLDSLRHKPPFPGIHSYLQYVAKLYEKEVHLFATAEVKQIEELRGKKVNFGSRDSDNFATATKIFGSLGIEVAPTEFSPTIALDKLREGEIAALVYVAPKPADLFNFGTDPKLHFLSIPASVRGGYTVTTLRPQDYYELIPPDQPVQTLAVGSVLMVYNWPRESDRYRKVARFVGRLLDEHAHRGTPSHSPTWPEIDIAAGVPGWNRYAPADKMDKSS